MQCQFFLALCDVICGTTKCVAAGLSNMTHSATLSIVRPIPHRGLSRVEAATYIGISASKFDGVGKGRERGTIDDAVAILGICARTVRQLALFGDLQGAAKIGRRWTFNLERLREYVKQKERELCRGAKHPRERSGGGRFSGDGFKPTVVTSDGRYARTIQSLRSQGEKGKEIDR